MRMQRPLTILLIMGAAKTLFLVRGGQSPESSAFVARATEISVSRLSTI